MQRIYSPSALGIDLEITDLDIHHQLTRVMRVKRGDHVIFFDGDGSETEYEITDIAKRTLSLRGLHRTYPKTEPEKIITLYQALPNKYEKIEYIIEKGIEVGIRHFIFFRSDHSQKLLISESKKKRFALIAKEALEQCGGLVMPTIEYREQGIGAIAGKKNIVLDTIGSSIKLQEMPQNDDLAIWVGPEGGWSDVERIKMKDSGFIFVRFGSRILRTETAGPIVAFSLINQ